MAIITLGKLLDRVEAFEGRLAIFFADVRDQSKDNGVRLLTYYLARHRRHQQQAFDDFDKQAINLVRRVKVRNDVPFTPEVEAPLLQAQPGTVSGKALLEAAVAYNAYLGRYYDNILKFPLNQDATFLILSLIRIEEHDTLMLKKMIAMHYF
ncbi:MAG: hypothetical protein WCO42_07205 [bacterium]